MTAVTFLTKEAPNMTTVVYSSLNNVDVTGNNTYQLIYKLSFNFILGK